MKKKARGIMRKLTVKRRKNFVGCAGKIHIYIEDAEGKISINGVSCRELGELKNGAEADFDISEEACRIFAIADKLSKDYCYDCYQLEAGTEDVTLSGGCKFNPAAGNAFRFDGSDSEDVKAQRRAGIKKGLIVLVASMAIGAVLGFGIMSIIIEIGNSKERVFNIGGMTITLNEGFSEERVAGYDAAFSSNHVNVIAVKEVPDKNSFAESCSVSEYARLVIYSNGLNDSEVKTDGELTYFVYDGTAGEFGRTYRYYVYVYKTEDAFWLVHFAVNLRKINKYEDKVAEWAASVSFE